MIEKLPWDSDFFGYPVGRLMLKDTSEDRLTEIMSHASDYRLIYLYAENEITGLPDIQLFDKKVFFEKPVTDSRLDETIIEFDPGKHDYDKLLHLALLSGSYSRFRIDPKFKNKEFEKLYKQWIDNSIQDSGIKVLVCFQQQEMAGFVTLDIRNEHRADIGLIAVSENMQGRHVGTKLMEACEHVAYQNHKTLIGVVTQSDNTTAMKFYTRRNYKVIKISHVYHYWNL